MQYKKGQTKTSEPKINLIQLILQLFLNHTRGLFSLLLDRLTAILVIELTIYVITTYIFGIFDLQNANEWFVFCYTVYFNLEILAYLWKLHQGLNTVVSKLGQINRVRQKVGQLQLMIYLFSLITLNNLFLQSKIATSVLIAFLLFDLYQLKKEIIYLWKIKEILKSPEINRKIAIYLALNVVFFFIY